VTPIANTQTEVKKNLANTTANSTPKAESKPVAPTPVVKETTTAKSAKPVVTTEKTEKPRLSQLLPRQPEVTKSKPVRA